MFGFYCSAADEVFLKEISEILSYAAAIILYAL